MQHIFEPGKRLGNIFFNASQEEIMNILGQPIEIIHEDGEECNTTDMDYSLFGIKISIIRFDNFGSFIQIQTDKLIYNGLNWYDLSKLKLLNIIKRMYEEYNIEYNFKLEKTDFEEFIEEQYDFNEIGVTLWFVDNNLDNLCVFKPEKELILPEPKKKTKMKTYQLEPLETNLLMVSEPKTEYKRTKK